MKDLKLVFDLRNLMRFVENLDGFWLHHYTYFAKKFANLVSSSSSNFLKCFSEDNKIFNIPQIRLVLFTLEISAIIALFDLNAKV